MGKLAFNAKHSKVITWNCGRGLLRSKSFTLADAEQTNSIFVADLRFAEQKKYLRLPALLTAQTSEPSVMTANFFKLIADFCISKIQFCFSCFSIFWKNDIYSTCSGKGKQYC